MDSYSFISENGTVREIADLAAREKNAQQDERLDAIEQTALIDRYSLDEVQTNKRWINGKPIFRKVFEVLKNGVLNTNWSRPGGSTFRYGPGFDFETLITNKALTNPIILTSWSPGTDQVNWSTGIRYNGNNLFSIINSQTGQFTGNNLTLILEYTKQS